MAQKMGNSATKFLLLLVSALFPIYSAEITTELLHQEIQLEKYFTDFVQRDIVDKILGPKQAVVIVDLELAIETTKRTAEASETKHEKKRKAGEIEYLLPGVPIPRSISEPRVPLGEAKFDAAEEEKAAYEMKTTIKRKSVTVLHDKRVPQAKLTVLKEAIVAALAITPPTDTLEFKPTDFSTHMFISTILSDLLQPKYLLPLLLSLLLLIFLFGPVSSFLRNYLRMLKERGGTEVTVDSKLEGLPSEKAGEGAAAGGAGALAELEEQKKQKEEEEKYIPFSYIDKTNLKKLIYLVRKEHPRTIAIILSYLEPEFIKEILSALPPSLQAQVALQFGRVREISFEELMALDQEIKTRVDLVVGDPEQLIKTLEEVDEATRENILEYLKSENPELYEVIRKRIIIFEDIVNFSDLAVQTIIREIKLETWARVLRGASTEVMNKILSNMSSGAATLLKEEMEYGRPLSPQEIMEEKKKIVDTIKKLEAEGRIFIREKVTTMITAGIEEVSEFDRYFQTAISLYEQGNYNEAIPYFQYCLQLNPNSSDVYQYLGNIYYVNNQFEEAISNYEKAVELSPENESLRSWLEQIKSSIGV